ncbi:MAG: zinc-binding dehydrogenase [Christensenellales bacterium]|jgi:threonine dehydrogenase-like Zn-dependent dehydrogenase
MTAKRIAFVAPCVARLEECEVGMPQVGEVRIAMRYTALSAGTEYAFLTGAPNTGSGFPRYLGYSASAVITAVGSGVFEYEVGQRVTVYHGRHQSVNNVPSERVAPIPDGLDDLSACMTEIGCMGLQGVRKLRMELGESGMVIGLGLLGLFAVQAMYASGVSPVIAVDYSEERRNLALELGARYAFSPDDRDAPEKVNSVTRGRGANGIVEVTGAESALQLALKLVSREGRIALTGCTREYREPVDFYALVHKPGVTIVGAHNAARPERDSRPGYWTRKDDEMALMELMRDGRINARRLIHNIASPEACEDVYARLVNGSLPLGTVFDWTKC